MGADELINYNKSEERALEAIVKEIADSGVKLVISGGSVSEMAVHFLEKYQLMCLKITSKWELRRLCGAIGCAYAGRDGLRLQGIYQGTRWTNGDRTRTTRRRPDEDRYCRVASGDSVPD